jgi:hypothetical protein
MSQPKISRNSPGQFPAATFHFRGQVFARAKIETCIIASYFVVLRALAKTRTGAEPDSRPVMGGRGLKNFIFFARTFCIMRG